MSNIYIHEPPTSGKVLLVTTVGDIDIELWSKEAPKACRNFVQLCMEGYYDGTIFHRLVRDFIVQGGDPEGTGASEGESIYGKPFNDEFHSRIRFVRRGLVAMANSGPNDNTSHFFFTLAATPELNNKNTIFGKVAGDTIYNMIKLADSETDGNDRPLYPQKIIKTKIISNPFDDIEPRIKSNKVKEDRSSAKSKSKATKNYKLLSFGEEAEEDEDASTKVAENIRQKGKSSHDLLNDERLSSVPAVEMTTSDEEEMNDKQKKSSTAVSQDQVENIRQKLKRKPVPDDDRPTKEGVGKKQKSKYEDGGQSEDFESPMFSLSSASKLKELRAEAKKLKRELKKIPDDDGSSQKQADDDGKNVPVNEAMKEFEENRKKYKEQQKKSLKKGSDREAVTLELLAKFQTKLETAKRLSEYDEDEAEEEAQDDDEFDPNDMSWMSHKLKFESKDKKVIDANITDSDRYEIFDPRNPMTVRRREASAAKAKDSHKSSSKH